MPETPLVVLCIKNKYQQMNPAMKQIADYIISNPNRVIYMGISELAAASSVSIASVTRFVKQAGYRNFKSFQLELAGSLTESVGPVPSGHDRGGLPEGIQQQPADALRYDQGARFFLGGDRLPTDYQGAQCHLPRLRTLAHHCRKRPDPSLPSGNPVLLLQ